MIDKDTILRNAIEIHGDRYNYNDITNINNVNEKLHIICPEHGDFYQTYWNHICLKRGCRKCGFLRNIEARKITNENFIQRSKLTHDDIENYDFSELDVTTRDEKGRITITCKKHGDFKVLLDNFLRRHSGCPICNQSHMEEEVRLFLIKNNIDFIQEKTFDWLKDKNYLFLDFYLPSLNVAIECQGIQHFKPIDFFGGEDSLPIIEHRDDLKYHLCEEHGIKIMYFTHSDLDYRYDTITSLKELKEAITH